MLIELHALQTFAPSNLNRDDTGNPKDALFGGVRRARISSQSAKRAIRISPIFEQSVGVGTGKRTKLVAQKIAERLIAAGISETDATAQAQAFVSKAFAEADKKAAGKTNVLVYISEGEFEWIAERLQAALTAGETPDIGSLVKDFEKNLRGRTTAPDIALFGRMLAEHPSLNLDAACQFAHALSTHEVASAEFDYYTAVDDLQPDDTSGAGMLGLVPFNSATYYRCARIDWDQLVQNLGGDLELAQATVAAFMRAFALVVPTGMKNSFLNQHAPDFLLAVVRPDNDGQSLMNAFERPVRAKNGFVGQSIDAVCAYWDRVEGMFRLAAPVLAVLNPSGHPLASTELASAERATLGEWIAAVFEATPEAQ